MSELIRARNTDGKVQDIRIENTGELKIVLYGTQTDGTITPVLVDSDGKLITDAGSE